MFFTSHILILIILQALNVNSFTLGREVNPQARRGTGNEKFLKLQDGARFNFSSFSPYTLFQLIKNYTESTTENLIQNEFDRRLSEEMFSIKQLLYERDKTLPTPTLEIKQRWPIIELMSKLNKNEKSDKDADRDYEANVMEGTKLNYTPSFQEELIGNYRNRTLSLTEYKYENTSEINAEVDYGGLLYTSEAVVTERKSKLIEKVIGLRSLDHMATQRSSVSKRFTYRNQQQWSTCTNCKQYLDGLYHTCGKNVRRQHEDVITTLASPTGVTCTHTPKLSTCVSSSTCPTPSCTTCSSCLPPIVTTPCSMSCPTCDSANGYPYTTMYPNFYMPYQFFMGVSREPPPSYEGSYYYQTTKKKRKKKKPKRKDKYLYYDDDSDESSEYDEYSENFDKTDRICTHTAKGDLVPLKIDVEDSSQRCTRVMYQSDKKQFIDKLVSDLKTFHGEDVLKDCYCHFSTTNSVFAQIASEMFLFISILLHYAIHLLTNQ